MIKEYLETTLSPEQKDYMFWSDRITQRMLDQLDNSILDNSFAIGLPYWSKQNPLLVKNFTWLAAKLGFGTTEVSKNYSRFTFNIALLDKEEITDYRTYGKLDRFLMTIDDGYYPDTLVKRNGAVHQDGIPRPAFNAACKRRFKLDTGALAKYRRPIVQNLIKSIKKGIELGNIGDSFFADEASFRVVANYCVDNYLDPDAEYNSEFNVQDQRGRAIYNILKRVGNYISNKDFRALLVVPANQAITVRSTDTDALNDIYYFIAELIGYKCLGGTEADKIEAGRLAYQTKELPKLDLKSEAGRSELHELIWLQRIYKKLDKVFKRSWGAKWDIPLEIDHSMSLAQIVGALTNDQRVLSSTSVIGNTISDPWYIEGVRRLSAKTIGTPTFYGSSATAISLMKGKNLLRVQNLPENATNADIAKAKEADKIELDLVKKEFSTGRFAVLKQFKNLLIQNYNVHTPVINIDTGFSQFTIHVNKFKQAGTETIVTEAFDGKKFKYSFTKEPVLVPDYARMKLFWATCLVHHTDSDLLEHNLAAHPEFWALGIHDAILALPGQARQFRETAAKRLKFYNENRYTIMTKYRQSTGATSPKSDVQYMKLMQSVVDAGDVPFSRMLMK